MYDYVDYKSMLPDQHLEHQFSFGMPPHHPMNGNHPHQNGHYIPSNMQIHHGQAHQNRDPRSQLAGLNTPGKAINEAVVDCHDFNPYRDWHA